MLKGTPKDIRIKKAFQAIHDYIETLPDSDRASFLAILMNVLQLQLIKIAFVEYKEPIEMVNLAIDLRGELKEKHGEKLQQYAVMANLVGPEPEIPEDDANYRLMVYVTLLLRGELDKKEKALGALGG